MEQLEVEKLVGELELGVDRLRSLYEQYFMGIEKLEPTVPRKDVDRRIHVLRREQIRNTALRFRFLMILQRYNTYQSHWQRICREIENGTYKRHQMRARQRFEGGRSSRPPPPPAKVEPAPAPLGFPEPGAALPAELAAELAELEKEFGPVARPAAAAPLPPGPPKPRPAGAPPPAPSRAPAPAGAAPAPVRAPLAPPDPTRAPAPAPARAPAAPAAPVVAKPAPAPAPKPAPRPPDGTLPEERVRALYSQYVDAKRRQNESTAAITYDAVAKSLRDSSAKLREKHGKSVDFEVTVRDGKAVLKPVLK